MWNHAVQRRGDQTAKLRSRSCGCSSHDTANDYGTVTSKDVLAVVITRLQTGNLELVS